MSTPTIIWCAQSSMHYIIEGSVRYAMPLYLAIQIKEYLKKCHREPNDCVARWVSDLGPADRTMVKISKWETKFEAKGKKSLGR
ncbi:MAG TPA: hypothetical protein VGD17_04555 [Chitinophagaceae bacterium]